MASSFYVSLIFFEVIIPLIQTIHRPTSEVPADMGSLLCILYTQTAIQSQQATDNLYPVESESDFLFLQLL